MFAIPKLLKSKDVGMLMIIAIDIVWFVYVMTVGGDWMEFRFMVPILPILFIWFVGLALFIVRDTEVRVALIIVLLVGPANSGYQWAKNYSVNGIVSIRDAGGDFETPAQVGKMLGEAFNYSDKVLMATAAAGVIPYYSRLRTIDMLGLSDRWVAAHGVYLGPLAGHQKSADLQYLIRSDVNIVIVQTPAQSVVEKRSSYSFADLTELGFVWGADHDWHMLPTGAAVTEIPHYNVALLYLTRSEVVDQTIEKEGWRVVPIDNLD
jgi:arabinofuranosyltransferase